MILILRMAWRNLFRHRGKTLVVGSILFLGALIMTVGNGVISGLNRGLEANVVNGFTGDLILISKTEKIESVMASMSGSTLEVLPPYAQLKEHLQKLPFINSFLPAATGYVWVLSESGQPIDQYILGVDFDAYQTFFPNNLQTTQGRFLKKGDRGVLVSTKMQKWIYEYLNVWAVPHGERLNPTLLPKELQSKANSIPTKDALVFLGLTRRNSSTDIFA